MVKKRNAFYYFLSIILETLKQKKMTQIWVYFNIEHFITNKKRKGLFFLVNFKFHYL